MKSCYRVRYVFLTVTVFLLILIVFFCVDLTSHSDRETGYILVEPGNSKLYFDDGDICFNSFEYKGTTYFFLPSWIDLKRISQDKTDIKLYTVDGSLLEDPRLSEVQDVMVSSGTPDEGEPWRVAFFKSKNLYSMNLHLDIEADAIERYDYCGASVQLYSPSGTITFSDNAALLKGRGNSTWEGASKKPYDLRLSIPASLCGMNESDQWSLIANYFDDTKLLDKLAMDLAGDIGMEYHIQSDWVDLYINDEYAGNYLLCQEPDISTGGLDIGNLEKLNDYHFAFAEPVAADDARGWEYDTGDIDISGGYLFDKTYKGHYEQRSCGFSVNDYFFSLKSPNNASMEEVRYIQSFVEKADRSIRSDEGKTDYIDPASFSRRYLVNVFFNDDDTNIASYFFYKKRGSDVLYAGPCWDYDMPSFHDYTVPVVQDDKPREWFAEEEFLDWDYVLLDYKPYYDLFSGVFDENEEAFVKLIFELVDKYASRIEASVSMDRLRWSEYDGHMTFYSTQENRYRFLKFYLYQRLLLIREYCGINDSIPELDLHNGEIHTIAFVYDDGNRVEMSVPDGEQLTCEELPPYDENEYNGWRYENDRHAFSPYVPIYEDMTFVLYKNLDDENEGLRIEADDENVISLEP